MQKANQLENSKAYKCLDVLFFVTAIRHTDGMISYVGTRLRTNRESIQVHFEFELPQSKLSYCDYYEIPVENFRVALSRGIISVQDVMP